MDYGLLKVEVDTCLRGSTVPVSFDPELKSLKSVINTKGLVPRLGRAALFLLAVELNSVTLEYVVRS